MDRSEVLRFELITKGTGFSSGSEENLQSPGYRLFRDTTSWTEYWQKTFTEPLPPTDFGQSLILCVFQGTKNTGGYSVEVSQVELDAKGELQVELDLKEPGPSDMVIQVFTEPYAFYRVFLPSHTPLQAGDLQVRFFRQQDDTKRSSVQMQRL